MAHTHIVSVAPAGSRSELNGSTIGEILIGAGRLTPENAERIARMQRDRGLRFGDAGIALRLLNRTDIDFALSRQYDYIHVRRGESKLSEMVVAAYAPHEAPAEALRTLRSELMLRWFVLDDGHKALAVISASRQEGRSFIAANLAVVFAQLGEYTLLIDADMRCPCQHELFGLENRVGLSAMLAARTDGEALQRISGLPRLSVLTAGAQPPNPLELLSRPAFPQLLHDLGKDYGVIILDTPPSSSFSDAQTVAGRAGAALIVARPNASRLSEVRGACDAATQAGATIVGTVLNKF